MSASDWVLALVCGLPNPARERAPIMTLKAFVDESGEGQLPVLVLAGWVSTASRWATFSDEWDVLLHTYGVSALHMTDAMTFNGEFRGWSRIRRDEFLTQAQRLVNEHTRSGIAYVLHLKDFAEAARAEPNMPKQMTRPYYYAFFGLIHEAIRNASLLGIDEPINFVFDERSIKDKQEIFAAWDDFATQFPLNRDLIGGSPTFESDIGIKPLQAADLSAWIIRARWIEHAQGSVPFKPPWFDKVIGEQKILACIWDRALFHQHVQKLAEARGEIMAQFSLGVLSFGE
jgi:hypothetical protein